MLDRINRVHDARIVRIDDGKKFNSEYQKLLRAYNHLVASGPRRSIATPQEQALLDKQQHDTYSDLPLIDQQRLKTEVDIMWNQIPEHLQDKAQRLAGLK